MTSFEFQRNDTAIKVSQRVGSLGDDVIEAVLDNQARLDRIKTQLLDTFEATYKSVREEVAVTNRDNMFLMIVNFLGGEFKLLVLLFWACFMRGYVPKTKPFH